MEFGLQFFPSGYAQEVGEFDAASLQVNFHLVSASEAASMQLFAQEVIVVVT